MIYPVYEDTYERRVKFVLPNGAQSIELTTDWYKDASRSLDYLATRPDVDMNKVAYLGVSMGSAEVVAIFQEVRVKAVRELIALAGVVFAAALEGDFY